MDAVMLAGLIFVGVLTAQFLLLMAWRREPVAATEGGSGVFAESVEPPRMVRALGQLATPSDPARVHGLQRDLIQAGLRGRHTLVVYLATRTALAFAFPAVGYIFMHTLTTAVATASLLVLAAIGYFLPVVVVGSLAEARRTRIRRVFPNALDMLVSCLESGLGIDAALRYAARELTDLGPELAGELNTLNAELQTGLARSEVLIRMRDRVGIEEVDGLVSVVAQAERYGVGIAESMRSHAKMSRRRRLLDSERRAAEAAPKLTVAMVLFVLPPLFIVLIGPTVIRLTSGILPTMPG